MAEIFWQDTLTPNIPELNSKMRAALSMYASTQSKVYEAYAKDKMFAKQKWVDRTGMAKATFNTRLISDNKEITIVFSHGVDYGIWLELAHESNYAVIKPTINAVSNNYFGGMKNLMDKIKI